MNLEVGVEEISELRMSESDEKTRNRDTSELECPRSTDKDSVSLETEKTVQESNISSSTVDTRSQDVSKCQSTLVDKDIAMETEEREIAPPHADIEEATDGERKDFHSVTSQPLVTTETEHPNDVEETDHTTVTQEMTETKTDLSLETRSKTQPDLSTDTMDVDNMETNNVDVIQAHPVTRQDVIDTTGAVELQQEEPYKEETPGGEENVQESFESESTSSEESESSSDSSDSEEEEEEVKNDKVKQDQPSQAKEEAVTQVTLDVPIEEFPDIILPEDVQLKAIGKISSIIGQLVVVQAYPNTPALDAETLLFNTDRQSIGVVNDTFGPVIQPCYSIQFSSAKKIEAVGLNLQHEIFFAPEVQDFTVYVFTQNLIKQKGSDASWKNDQEPPPEFLDYSDDEQEKMAKKSLKEAKGKKPKPRKAFKSTNDGHVCVDGVQHQGQVMFVWMVFSTKDRSCLGGLCSAPRTGHVCVNGVQHQGQVMFVWMVFSTKDRSCLGGLCSAPMTEIQSFPELTVAIPQVSIIKAQDQVVGGAGGTVPIAVRNSGPDGPSMTTMSHSTPHPLIHPNSQAHLQAPLPHFFLQILVGISSPML
ncbi:H/ACA ribonucleoprotein complex non-core subunit naf1 [Branchiostoma belcheri]|nr:H/ACA ribonucleoprotein complex non-core subunit naf1 [Branchiostoma belcheri]